MWNLKADTKIITKESIANQTACQFHVYLPCLNAWLALCLKHGRMGTLVRNNFLSGRPKKMSKGPVDHTKKWVELWLAAVSPCRAPISRLSPLPVVEGGTLFLYLSNPPSGNLLPILPWFRAALLPYYPCWKWLLSHFDNLWRHYLKQVFRQLPQSEIDKSVF